MALQAQAPEDSQTDKLITGDSVELKFYRVRDDCVRAYQPANEEEMFLVMQIARTWYRLERYYDLEAELIGKSGLANLFETDLERFNVLTRSIVAAERMWRHAVKEFEAARRRRGESLASPRRPTISTVGSERPRKPLGDNQSGGEQPAFPPQTLPLTARHHAPS